MSEILKFKLPEGIALVISNNFDNGIAIEPFEALVILHLIFKLISKSVALRFNSLLLTVNKALLMIGSVDLDGTAFDKSCKFFKRSFLSIENSIITSFFII